MLKRYFFETIILAKSFCCKSSSSLVFCNIVLCCFIVCLPQKVISSIAVSLPLSLASHRSEASECRFDTFEIIFHSIPLRWKNIISWIRMCRRRWKGREETFPIMVDIILFLLCWQASVIPAGKHFHFSRFFLLLETGEIKNYGLCCSRANYYVARNLLVLGLRLAMRTHISFYPVR